MRIATRIVLGIGAVAALAAPLSAGGAAGRIGYDGGPTRLFTAFHGRLPGDRSATIVNLVATNFGEERVLWSPRDRAQDWVQFVDDGSVARFLLREDVRGVRQDRDSYAFFGVRDDEDLESVMSLMPGSFVEDDRGQIYAPMGVATARRRSGAGLRGRETWFGEISRDLLSFDWRHDAVAVRDFGVRRVGALSSAERTGRREWTLAFTVENRTGSDYAFSWPSVLTDAGEAWEGTAAAGSAAVLTRVVDSPPRIVTGAVALTLPGGVHPDFRGPAEHFATR